MGVVERKDKELQDYETKFLELKKLVDKYDVVHDGFSYHDPIIRKETHKSLDKIWSRIREIVAS